MVVAPYWPGQPWFREIISLAATIVVFEKSNNVFLPVNKFNRSFASSTRWETMLLYIGPHKKKRWFHLKVDDIFQPAL